MAEELDRCSAGITYLFFVVFLSNYRLVTFRTELKVVGEYKLTKLERAPSKTPYRNILFEALSDKVLCINMRMLRGCKSILFVFVSYSFLCFGSWGNFKVLTLDFECFFSEVHRELYRKAVLNFPHFLSSPTVTSQVLFLTIIRQFSRPLYHYEGRKTAILTLQYLRNASSNSLATSEYV